MSSDSGSRGQWWSPSLDVVAFINWPTNLTFMIGGMLPLLSCCKPQSIMCEMRDAHQVQGITLSRTPTNTVLQNVSHFVLLEPTKVTVYLHSLGLIYIIKHSQ